MTRKHDTPYRDKGLSVFLTVIMVLSVVAMSAAFAAPVAALEDEDIEYGPSQTADDEIEVTFADDQEGELDEDNYTVWDYSGDEIEITTAPNYENDGYTVELDLDDPLVGGDAYLEIDGENHSIETASQFYDIWGGNDSDDPFAGEHVAITNITPGEVLTIEHPDGERDRGAGENSTVRVIDTGEWESGDQINITGSDSENTVTLDLRSYDIDAETDQTEYDQDDEIVVSAESDRVQRPVVVNLYDDDGDRVDQIEDSLGPDGDVSVSFDASNLEGDYSAAVYDRQTWISGATDTFSVAEVDEPDATVEFGNLTEAAEGDIATIEVDIEEAGGLASNDTIVWVNESDYNANVTIEFEDGDFDGDRTLELEWNTYEAGASPAADGSEEVFNVTNYDNVTAHVVEETNISHADNFRLNPAGYTLAAFQDGTAENRVDSASLAITERSTGNMTTGVVPNATDVSELDWVLDNATATDEVAELDYLVIEQEITGIFGYTDAADEDSYADAGVHIELSPEETPAYQSPTTFNLTDGDGSDNLAVIADADEGALYFVLEHNTTDLEEGDEELWDIEFSVTDDNPYIDEDEDETTESEYSLVHRFVEIGVVEPPYQVTPDENAVIEGTSSLAPGTNVTVEVDKPGHFIIDDDTAQVQDDEDRTWTFTHDFSDREIGEEFQIEAWETEIEVATDSADGIFDDVAEADTLTGEEALQGLLDDIAAALGVEDHDDILGAIEALQADLAQAEADRDDAQAEAQEYMTALEEAQDDIADLQDDLDDRDDTIADLEGEISDLEGEISDLEGQIADLEGQISDWQDATGVDSPGDYEADDDDQPAFGPIAALLAIMAGGALVARRRLNN